MGGINGKEIWKNGVKKWNCKKYWKIYYMNTITLYNY